LFCVPAISVCRAAGKRLVYDESYAGQKIISGQWTEAEKEAKLAKEDIHGEVIDPRATMAPLQRQLPWGRVHH
jgi:hypothetical protein